MLRPPAWLPAALAGFGLLGAAPGWMGQATPKLPQIPTIRANTTLVDVPVLVLDKQGQPLDSLTQSDFRIFDDGQEQELSGFDNQPRPLSLAIVVDTSDYDAIGQAKRSAELIRTMVVGAQGTASIFIPGPEPQQLLPFTADGNKIADQLRHLTKSPTAPLGEGSITEPLNLAMLDLRHQPRENTRAALVISRASSKGGEQAQALMESGMSDAIPIFHLSPNRPDGAQPYVNPVSPEQRGTGQGSQRVQAPPAPVDSRGQPTSGSSTANMDLGPIIGAAASVPGKIFAPHNMDWVYNSGGMSYSAGDDRQFDQKLSQIGDELRAIYHLYYSPNNLSRETALHQITVKLDLPATAGIGTTAYRRTYLGAGAH